MLLHCNWFQMPVTKSFGLQLTHWVRLTHVWVSKTYHHWFRQSIISSDNDVTPGRRQANQCRIVVNWTLRTRGFTLPRKVVVVFTLYFRLKCGPKTTLLKKIVHRNIVRISYCKITITDCSTLGVRLTYCHYIFSLITCITKAAIDIWLIRWWVNIQIHSYVQNAPCGTGC